MSANPERSRELWRPYRVPVLHKTLIVSAQTDKEENARHVLETMDPFPPLALLAADVDHQHFMIPEVKAGFRNADRPSSAVNDVLLVRNVLRIKEPFQIGEVVVQAIWDTGKRPGPIETSEGRPRSTRNGEMMDRYSLFRQCRFIAPRTGFLDVNVRPQGPERFEVVSGKRLSVREVGDFAHHLEILDVIIGHFEVHVFHSLENVSQSKCEVVENQLSVVFDFLRRERDFVDKPHLLDKTG